MERRALEAVMRAKAALVEALADLQRAAVAAPEDPGVLDALEDAGTHLDEALAALDWLPAIARPVERACA